MPFTLDFLTIAGNSEHCPDMVPGKVTAVNCIQDFGDSVTIWEGTSKERKSRKRAKEAKKKRKAGAKHDSSHGSTKKPPKYDFTSIEDLGIGIIEAPSARPMPAASHRGNDDDDTTSSSNTSEHPEILPLDDGDDNIDADSGDSAGDDNLDVLSNDDGDIPGNSEHDQVGEDNDDAFIAEVDAIFSELGIDGIIDPEEGNHPEPSASVAGGREDGQDLVEDPPRAGEDLLDVFDIGFVRRGPRVAEERFILADRLGEIRYNVQGNFFRAHCPIHENCQRRRAATASDRLLGQGRPLGLLTHWLKTASLYDSKQVHMAAGVGNFSERSAAREALLAMPHSVEFSRHERCVRATEGPEPSRIP